MCERNSLRGNVLVTNLAVLIDFPIGAVRRYRGNGHNNCLDREIGHSAAQRHARVMVADDEPDANTAKPRILFVEDEATLREHLALKLSDTYLVDTAGNGNEALLAVMRAKPALVVTDIVMPDMDGVELLVTLRQNPGTRAIPVLLISGRAADEYRIEGF